MSWLLTAVEVAELLEKSPAASKVWLHRHCIKAARSVQVEARSPRALYDGATVAKHQAATEPTCPGCVSARRGTTRRRTQDSSGRGTHLL